MKAKQLHLNRYKGRLIALLKHPFFWLLTITGNAIILLGGLFLYIFEKASVTPELEFIDCVLWSTGLVTTVGYADYVPESLSGKITVLILMLSGTLFVWAYMGFLVTGLIAPELSSLNREVHEVEKEILGLKSNKQNDGQSKDTT